MPSRSKRLDIRPTASLTALERRSNLLRALRGFFHDRGLVEVETPLLAAEVIPELHIEPITVGAANLQMNRQEMYLQASPELHMKRLLAAGATAIFQVTRSFRAGERGRLHNPEFTIVEWYRAGDDMNAGMDLLDELTQSLLHTPPSSRTTYAEAFQRTINLCPHTAPLDELAAAAKTADIAVSATMDHTSRDEWLNLLLATQIESQLGRERPEIVYHYPASQASLAKTVPVAAGYEVAERFELYYHGIELANGFYELTDAAELRQRFDVLNEARIAAGRNALPVPESLLAAMEHSLPNCSGCALGFDRLVMLAVGAQVISEVMSFSSERQNHP
jgi:lysyl-tRNA synthetase class 2